MNSTPLVVITANIGRLNATQERARNNIIRVHTAFPTAIIGWQEIDEADQADEHRILRTQLQDYTHVGMETAVPISIPKPWKVLARGVRQACKGLEKVTPTRHIVWAKIKHPDLKKPVRIANGHYPLPRLGPGGQLRWDETHESWTEFAHEMCDERENPLTLITTRDTNKHDAMPLIHRREKQHLVEGIDEISSIAGATVLQVDQRWGDRSADLTIDGHNARGKKFRLSDQS